MTTDQWIDMVTQIFALLIGSGILYNVVRIAHGWGKIQTTMDAISTDLHQMRTTMDGLAKMIRDHEHRISVIEGRTGTSG